MEEEVSWPADLPAQATRLEDLIADGGPREIAGFRFATVIDWMWADGKPVIAMDRGLITDPEQRRRILQYLRGAATVYEDVATFGPDCMEPACYSAVPTGYRTDGAWIWPMAAEYYLDRHSVAPEPEFYERIRFYGYRCPPVTEPQVDRAGQALRSRATLRPLPYAQAPPAVQARFPVDVYDVLVRFGWRPCRDVGHQVRTWFDELCVDQLREEESWTPSRSRALAAAQPILREFGGLDLLVQGPGRDHVVSPFRFYPLPSERITGLADVYGFGYLERKLGRPLFPIGEVGNYAYDMGVDPDGRIYLAGDLDFALGENIDEALIKLVQGRHAERVPPCRASKFVLGL